MLTKDQIQQTIAAYFVGKPVLRAYLFGSFARGEADSESDIDVLIDLDYNQKGSIWAAYVGMMDELSQKLRRKVDLVSSDGLSEHVAPFVHQDKILVYER